MNESRIAQTLGKRGKMDEPGACLLILMDLWVMCEMRPVASLDHSLWQVVLFKRLKYTSQDHLDLQDPKS